MGYSTLVGSFRRAQVRAGFGAVLWLTGFKRTSSGDSDAAWDSAGDDGEARAVPLGRADFDAVPEQIGRVLDDEEPEAEPVHPALIVSPKGPEDRRQGVGTYADSGVANLDPQFRAAPARRDEHATAGRRVVNCIAYQVSQHAGQQNRVTESRTGSRSDAKRDPFHPCRLCQLPRKPPD